MLTSEGCRGGGHDEKKARKPEREIGSGEMSRLGSGCRCSGDAFSSGPNRANEGLRKVGARW